MIPNLIVPGAAKSGTSSLHDFLNQHPEIQMSTSKEPHLYSIDKNYLKRFDMELEGSFTNIFNKYKNIKYYGESSTSYLPSSKIVAERLYKDNPNVKFIILLRDPIERIESHYNWIKSFGCVNKPIFEEVMTDYELEYDCNKSINGNYKSYIHHTLYYQSINNFLEYFKKDNFLIITTEELKKHHQLTMNKCFDFLGINNVEVLSSSKNKTEYVLKNTGLKQKLLPLYLKLPFFVRQIIPSGIKKAKVLDNKKVFQQEKFSELEKKEIIFLLRADLKSLKENFGIKFN